MEAFYPLRALVCDRCFLVQLEEFESPKEIFTDYVYFSSYSSSWLEHCKEYVDTIVPLLGLDASSTVVELASNDGYLLQYFVDRGIPAFGIEPAANVAQAAVDRGIPTVVEFFSTALARRLSQRSKADLIIANNVLAHVPNLNDFVRGIKSLLAANGRVTLEFPHLLTLLRDVKYDTIYHEHFSYFSLTTVQRVFRHQGLTIIDVEELATHGGSLRIHATHSRAAPMPSTRMAELLDREAVAGLLNIETYTTFEQRVRQSKRDTLDFFISAKREGKRIAAYGAAAKGNTLLNYCGMRTDFIDFVVDANPHKQGLFLPGTHIPVLAPTAIMECRPDLLFILPWNLKEEILSEWGVIRTWGASFVTHTPQVTVLE